MEPVISQSSPQTADDAMKQLLQAKIGGFNPLRLARFLQIKRNIAYLCGHQNIDINNGSLVEIPKDDEMFYPVMHNKILEGVVNDIATGTKTEPISYILPAGTDEDDKATAKVCENIKQYLYRINSMQEIRKGVILWYDIDGIGWTKTYFDPQANSRGENPQDPQDPDYDQNYQPGQARFQGEVCVDVIPNTELIYDRRSTRPDKMKWMIQVKTVTLGYVATQFGPDFAAKIAGKAEESIPATDTFDQSVMGDFLTLAGNMAGPKSAGKIPQQDKVLSYYEFWHIPDVMIPMGAYAIAVGSVNQNVDMPDIEIAMNMPYPINTYRHGKLPFTPWRPLSLDGIDGGGISRIGQAIPLQRHYNRMMSQIGENCTVMGNGMMFSPKGANLETKRLSSGTGTVIEYEGQFKPTREAGVPVPGSIFAWMDRLEQKIDSVFAFHEPSRGIMPTGGPRSAVGLQTLQDADSTQLSPIVRGLDIAEQEVVYQMINLALATYGGRTMNIIGKDNQWALYAVNPEELRGKINVIIKTGSSAPYSKDAQSNKIFSVWQSGLLNQPMDPTRLKIIKAMDLGNFDSLLQDNSKDINFAQREFQSAEQVAAQASTPVNREELAANAFVPNINSFDDHNTHIVEHGNYLKDKYWEFIGSGNPNLIALANAMNIHIQMHQQILFQQQYQMAMLANPGAFNNQDEEKEDKKKAKSKSDESK